MHEWDDLARQHCHNSMLASAGNEKKPMARKGNQLQPKASKATSFDEVPARSMCNCNYECSQQTSRNKK